MPRATAREDNTGVIIQGMHRSGTSATARLLGALGCSYGGRLMEPKEDNPEGYWEHADVVDIHDAFLASLTMRWDDPRRITADHFTSKEARTARRAIEALFEKDFAAQPLWTLKDPRHCRLLPLWDTIIDARDVHFMYVLRDPYAVAESLAARNPISLQQSCLLWMRHYLESERYTRGMSRTWIHFDEMISDPAFSMRRACERLGISDFLIWPPSRASLEDLVNPRFVHHKGVHRRDPAEHALYSWVERAYGALDRLARKEVESEEPLGELDRVRDELERAEDVLFDGLVLPLGTRVGELAEEQEKALEHIRGLEDYVKRLERDIEDKNCEISTSAEYARHLERDYKAKIRELEEVGEYARQLESAARG